MSVDMEKHRPLARLLIRLLASPGLEASDEQVRALAAEILARKDYASWRFDAEAWQGVIDWLAGFTRWLEGLRVDAPGLYWLLIAGLLATALGLLAHVVWTVSLALRATPPVRPGERAAAEGPGLLARAEALARDGRYLAAAQQLERATLELLLQERVIELARSEPNRVLRRRLGEAPLPEGQRRELVGLIDRLERRLFRDRTEDPGLYASWQVLYRRLRRAA